MMLAHSRKFRALLTLSPKPTRLEKLSKVKIRTTVHTLSSSQRVHLTIIGAGGAIGLPASYLATMRNLKVVMIDSGSAAINNSTHTVHTSIVRPNRAIWPFGKALNSWLNDGPFDVRFSSGMVPFGIHSMLQSYCVSENQIHRMWKAFRTLGLESQQIYLNFDREFGPITLGGTGRGHLSSPLVADDKEVVLALREKLCRFGIESEILVSSNDIQNYVGRLPVRHPELMVRYPEDFVLDLPRYKTRLLTMIGENGGIHLQDTVIGIEQDSRGKVTTVITERGHRIQTDVVFYAGGWNANTFIKKWFGINLNGHLNVASGVRFVLPDHLVDRSIVCGPMFLAPGHDSFGNPITDVGQMFLANITDPYPSAKHLAQATRRFHTYFNYQGDIPKIWNCVGRPITTTGLPFIERVAPNMVVALGPGMFGVTLGASLAQRGLDLLLDNKTHPDQAFFERQSSWKITYSFFKEKLSPAKPSVKADSQPSPKSLRVIQLGKRGAMTGVLHQTLAQSHDCAVYGAREIDAVIRDIRTHPDIVLLVASHGPQAKLPAHYGKDYLSADQAIEKVLAQTQCQNLSGIVVISGSIPKTVLQELMLLARNRKVRFVHLPSLATSMEVLLNAVQSLLPQVDNPHKIIIEDTFHKGKKEIPSTGGSQLLADIAKRFGKDQLLILVSDSDSQTELSSQYPGAAVKIARADDEIQKTSHQFPDLIPVVCRSYRIDTPYRYQHRFTLQEDTLTITFEQSVANRAQLVPPVCQVIQKLTSLPPGFSGTSICSVLPVITFKARSSITEVLASIIDSLRNADAILCTRTRHAEPDQLIQTLLTDSSGQIIRFQYTPSLSCSLHIEAKIDAQPFSISLSATTTS